MNIMKIDEIRALTEQPEPDYARIARECQAAIMACPDSALEHAHLLNWYALAIAKVPSRRFEASEHLYRVFELLRDLGDGYLFNFAIEALCLSMEYAAEVHAPTKTWSDASHVIRVVMPFVAEAMHATPSEIETARQRILKVNEAGDKQSALRKEPLADVSSAPLD